MLALPIDVIAAAMKNTSRTRKASDSDPTPFAHASARDSHHQHGRLTRMVSKYDPESAPGRRDERFRVDRSTTFMMPAIADGQPRALRVVND